MEGENANVLVARVRALGMEVWVEDGVVRGKMRVGGKIPYNVRVIAEELRGLGQIAVDYLEREAHGEPTRANVAGDGTPWDDRPAVAAHAGASPAVMPEPDAGGWVVLEGVSSEMAFMAGDLINDGTAELIGKVIYHRWSGKFDLTYKLTVRHT